MMKKNRHPSNDTSNDANVPEDIIIDDIASEAGTSADAEVLDGMNAKADGSDVGEESDLSPEARIQSLQDKVAVLEDAVLRGKAEIQNVQRRGVQQRQDAIRFANADLMKSMLSVVDDFQRAIEAASKTDDVASVVDGIKLVHENFMKAMTEAGLEPIDAVNQPFDPHVHEAMLQQPSDKHEPGTVIEEITKGFKLRDRTLRPARVIVSKSVDEPSS
ncbi:nucleotide exchange factor GrpE [bacterium AH-315-J04]|nr:nucleotide exchange factor GrpE [bacterium AH-315-J04]